MPCGRSPTKDAAGSVARGDVLFEDSRNTLVYAQDRMVACVGLDDAVIVRKPPTPCWWRARTRPSASSRSSLALKAGNAAEASAHRKIHRPWRLVRLHRQRRALPGEAHRVVNPGARLSLQTHHRARALDRGEGAPPR